MDYLIHLTTEGAAFEERGASLEVARILRELATSLEEWDHDGEPRRVVLRDANGNTVGLAESVREEEVEALRMALDELETGINEGVRSFATGDELNRVAMGVGMIRRHLFGRVTS